MALTKQLINKGYRPMSIEKMTAYERAFYVLLGTLLLLVYMIPEKIEVVQDNRTVIDSTVYNVTERDSLVTTVRESTVIYTGLDTLDSEQLEWVKMVPSEKPNTFSFEVPVLIDKRPDWGPNKTRDARVSIVDCDYWECNDE